MLLDTYKKLPYTKEIDSNTSKLTEFKFESPFHFVSFIEEIDRKGIKESRLDHSETNGEDFCASKNLKHAFEIFRTAKYDPKEGKKTSLLVNKLRHKSGYFDEGDEISIPEFLAGSEKHYLQFGERKTKLRGYTFRDPLVIRASYNAGTDANAMLVNSQVLIDCIYRNKFRFPKFIFSFGADETYGDQRMESFVDVNYTDFNSVVRLIHPSTFRRLTFRLREMHKDLQDGYGSSRNREGSSIRDGLVLSEFEYLKKEEIEEKVINLVKDYLKK